MSIRESAFFGKKAVGLALLLATTAGTTTIAAAAPRAGEAGWSHASDTFSQTAAIADFQSTHSQSALMRHDNGRIGRVYGRAFSHGASARASVETFINLHSGMWGVGAGELVAEGPFDDGHDVQPIGYLPETDSYKFTGYYYRQYKQGVPVFRSRLTLLVRNEADNPLVLASAQLFDLNGLQLDGPQLRQVVDQDRILETAKKIYAAEAKMIDTERVVYAGDENTAVEPRLADATRVSVNGFEKYLLITDAATGEVLYREDLILHADVAGNASGIASDGPATAECGPEISKPLPYLVVSGDGQSAITDINGDFMLQGVSAGPITVGATLDGQWFDVSNYQGAETSESVGATAPGPADLEFNSANNNEFVRAQVNGYVESNVVRDFAIAANPSYPTLMNQNFPCVVNRNDGFCPGNAWYDPGEQSINFCSSNGSSPNTAWSSVIYHEYGHHLVSAGGSGQDQYGEGMGDVMSTIILDDPRLGLGFFGNCNTSLRNADNAYQYPCTGGGHECGQLISGCVWDTREALVITEPVEYQNILNFLAVNAILVHSGSTITPQITIDWLTLDDDDADIGNGTPHYNEIATGFGAHNMPAPPLALFTMSFPDGQPEQVNPNGGTTMVVQFETVSVAVDPSTPTLMTQGDSGFDAHPMTQLNATQFEATFPETTCGSQLAYYITAATDSGQEQTSPTGAPSAGTHSTIAAFGEPSIAFADDFQADLGWTVSNQGGLSDGQWERGDPVGCNRGDPADDFDGSGMCFLTDNSSADGCNSDVDGGTTILTSPVLDASGGATVVSYRRWYDNTAGASPGADIFEAEVSDDAGATWQNLETVGPSSPEASGGWFKGQFGLADIPGFTPNDQFRIRFLVSDLGSGSVIEAGIDAFELLTYACDGGCPADLTGDGVLDLNDVQAFITAFTTQDLIADLTGDGILDLDDVQAFIQAFVAGCP